MKYYLILIFCFCVHYSDAQKREQQGKFASKTRILFLFDGSQSMYARWQSDIKINIARELLSHILDSLRGVENLELALRVYGHQHHFPPQVCTDTKLEVPFGERNIDQIKYRLDQITPRGTTLIAYALRKAADDFPPCSDCRNIVVLITDGIEECGGDPCEVSQRLQKQGVILQPFIIGIGRDFESEFDCAGEYYDATSEEQFQKALKVVIAQALEATTVQVNLLDAEGNATETDVAMTFYDSFSGMPLYNFIHTMNSRGLPDTMTIDPIPNYKLVVHTVPPVVKENVQLKAGRHNTLAVDASTGTLFLKRSRITGNVNPLQCIVRKTGEHEILNVQNFDTEIRYRTGYYDLEILCLPRISIDSVLIKQNSKSSIEVPMPGIAVIKKNIYGSGSLFLVDGKELKWIYTLRDGVANQESLILQPGRYKVVFRSRNSDRAMYTIERNFNIESGRTTNVKLYSN